MFYFNYSSIIHIKIQAKCSIFKFYIKTLLYNKETVNDEYTYLSSLNGLTPIDNSNSKIITINDSSIKNNINEIRLSNYYQKDINKQKKFYEDMGYTCNILK